MFQLHPQLQNDTIFIGRFSLSHLLLMNDCNYPWFILVPDRENIQEIYQLEEHDRIQLIKESSYLAQQLAQTFNADKMNIAALGNIVPQLHIHHIVRYKTDSAWPGPIWGKVPIKTYTDEQIALAKAKLAIALTKNFHFN